MVLVVIIHKVIMRLKKTKIVDQVKNRIEPTKYFPNSHAKKMEDMIYNDTELTKEEKLVLFNSSEYIKINYSKDWISIAVIYTTLNRNTLDIIRVEKAKIVVSKKRLHSSFCILNHYTFSEILSKLSRVHYEYLGLEWYYDLTKTDYIHSYISKKTFYQILRGYITNPTTLRLYQYTSSGLDEKTARHITDWYPTSLIKGFTRVPNITKILAEKSRGDILNNQYSLLDYFNQLRLMNTTSNKTTYRSMMDHHNELSSRITRIRARGTTVEVLESVIQWDDERVIPLVTNFDFYNWGNRLNNCLFSNDYFHNLKYKFSYVIIVKLDRLLAVEFTLILRDDGHHINIRQCYADHNESSTDEEHDEVMKILESHKSRILDWFKVNTDEVQREHELYEAW